MPGGFAGLGGHPGIGNIPGQTTTSSVSSESRPAPAVGGFAGLGGHPGLGTIPGQDSRPTAAQTEQPQPQGGGGGFAGLGGHPALGAIPGALRGAGFTSSFDDADEETDLTDHNPLTLSGHPNMLGSLPNLTATEVSFSPSQLQPTAGLTDFRDRSADGMSDDGSLCIGECEPGELLGGKLSEEKELGSSEQSEIEMALQNLTPQEVERRRGLMGRTYR